MPHQSKVIFFQTSKVHTNNLIMKSNESDSDIVIIKTIAFVAECIILLANKKLKHEKVSQRIKVRNIGKK